MGSFHLFLVRDYSNAFRAGKDKKKNQKSSSNLKTRKEIFIFKTHKHSEYTTYNICKEVKFPSTGGRVPMKSFMLMSLQKEQEKSSVTHDI